LHIAARWARTAVVKALIERHAPADATDREGRTPLHVAAKVNGDAVVTPLHVAAEWGAEGIARTLLAAGAQVAAQDRDGRTPLHQAARTTRRLSAGNGQLGVARLLIDRGASLETRTKSGATPLHLAAEGGAVAAAQLFLDHGAGIEARTTEAFTPLHLAVKNGHAQIVQLLLDRGASVAAADRSGKTPLHLAAEQGREGLARLLLEGGAAAGALDAEGRMALHEPSGRGHLGVVRLLLAAGASAQVADRKGWTPLHMAAFHGHEPVLRLLLSQHAAVASADAMGLTPLHAAAMYGYEAIVRLLIEAGASAGSKDRQGLTPVDYARENGRSAVLQSLGPSASTMPAGSAELSLPDLPLVKVDGSSTVYPLSAAVADEYQSAHREAARVTIGISGTGGGFRKFCRGETDLQSASRPIAPKEMEACKANGVGYVELPVAYDAVSVVVSVNNTWADSVTLSELKAMWEPAAQGRVSLWSLVRPDWPAAPLKLYGAGADSGTFDYFTEAVVGEAKASRTDYTGSEDDNYLVEQIAENRFALGYLPYAYLEPNRRRLKVLAIDAGKGPVFPSRATVMSAEYQPLSRPMFLYVNHRSTARSAVKDFVEFYLSNASRQAEAVRYVPFRDEVYRVMTEKFRQGKKGTVFAGRSAVGMRVEDILSREAQS
jgi:phosphate transport system substrate-binding protein